MSFQAKNTRWKIRDVLYKRPTINNSSWVGKGIWLSLMSWISRQGRNCETVHSHIPCANCELSYQKVFILYNHAIPSIAMATKPSDNYYEILGLSKSCTENEIRKAYRRLTLVVHPDKQSELKNDYPKVVEIATTVFKWVRRIYEVLKLIYDSWLTLPSSSPPMKF